MQEIKLTLEVDATNFQYLLDNLKGLYAKMDEHQKKLVILACNVLLDNDDLVTTKPNKEQQSAQLHNKNLVVPINPTANFMAFYNAVVNNDLDSLRLTGYKKKDILKEHNRKRNHKGFAISNELHPYPGRRHKLRRPFPEPTLEQKLSAAVYISTMGIFNAGVRTQATLMWPLSEFSEGDVERFATKFLGDALGLFLQALPPQDSSLLKKLQDEHLFFVEEPQSPDDISHKTAL